MAPTDKDIERLDGRIDKKEDRCTQTHNDLNKCLTEIKTGVARLEERMISAFGELDEGTDAFATLNDRVAALEKQQARWKGTIAAVGVGITLGINFILFFLKIGWEYIKTKGGGS